MRIIEEPQKEKKEPTFSWVEPGTIFKSKGGSYYMKLDVASHYKFNAVNVSSGKIVGFNPKTKVIELLDAELHLNENN